MKMLSTFGVFMALLAGLLFSGYATAANSPGRLRMVSIEIQAACRDAGTQWMVVVCLLSYLIVFLFLEKRLKFHVSSSKSESDSEAQGVKLPSSILHLPSSTRQNAISYLLTPISSANFWLLAFIALVLLRYAFDYTNAARSLQVVVLLTGIVVGKGVALWARSFGSGVLGLGSEGKQPTPINREMESNDSLDSHAIQTQMPDARPRTQMPDARPRTLLLILVVLLACAALWQPERGMEFQYRGQRRWTGVWDNPNTYGVLMGTGLTLALGLLGSRVLGLGSGGKRATSNEVGRGSPLPAALVTDTDGAHGVTRPTFQLSCSPCVSWLKRIGFPLLLIGACGLCGFGLLKSYSRGAWLGTAVGIGYLMWRFMECGGMTPPWVKRHVASGKSCAKSQQSKSWMLPSSIFLLSILIICFWQFRHTESPLLRRVFSVGNPNDFSWRNRVTAWQGAGRMMWDKPLVGFGWGKAEEIYSKDYRAARLEESAAVQLNDYLMIGISAGVPALACFVAYLWLALSLRSNAQSLKLGEVGRGSPLPAVGGASVLASQLVSSLAPQEARRTINFQPSTVALSGAMVLLIGFWFDGGLFKLPTCVVFWVLLELCRRRGDESECLTTMPAGGASVRASRLVSSLAPPEAGGAHGVTRPTIVLCYLAGLIALAALGMTTLHLGTPQLAVSERTLNIARKFLVPPQEKADFEYLAAKNIWSNTPLKTLLQHAHLANYNRTLVNWKLEDQLYREFVLSPATGLSASKLSNGLNWRRPLWEYFYPRIRKESSLEAAAEIIVRNLSEACRRRGDETQIDKAEVRGQKSEMEKSILELWRRQTASDAEFERISVAALRSAGIPARLSTSGQAEFWNGAEWKPAPRPVEAKRDKG